MTVFLALVAVIQAFLALYLASAGYNKACEALQTAQEFRRGARRMRYTSANSRQISAEEYASRLRHPTGWSSNN